MAASAVSASLSLPPCSAIVMSPPLAIDGQDLYNRGFDTKQKSVVFKVLDVIKGMRPGTDLTSFQVPAQLNLPKSQLQCYGEQVYCCGQNLLELCTDGATPVDRFLAVVRWHLSTLRPVPFGKAPYNPILGETHHVTAGDLNLVTEQVSHHPPVSALYATNSKRKITILQSNFSQPKFYGNAVTINIDGQKTLTLGEHDETYEMTCAKLNFRFWPGTCSEWIGDTLVRCVQTGLEARVSLKSSSYFSKSNRNKVAGKILRTGPPQELLYTLSGKWDSMVMVKNEKDGSEATLYDANKALTNLKSSEVSDQQNISPLESAVVWSDLTRGVCTQDWELARKAKSRVEEGQRASRTQRKRDSESWKPQYFTKTAQGEWEWAAKGQPVSPGPISW